MFQKSHFLFSLSAIAIALALLNGCSSTKDIYTQLSPYRDGVEKLRYYHPDLLVDLDVGFKSVPMPMDFDGDGDIDLLVSASGAYMECGVFYFENISGNVDMPIYRAGEKLSFDRFRLGYEGVCFVVSEVEGRTHVLTPDRVKDKLLIYEDVPQNVFWKKRDMPNSIQNVMPDEKSTWKMLDWDGDGLYDLMSAQSIDKGEALFFHKNIGTNAEPDYQSPIKVKMQTSELPADELYLDMDVPLADYDHDGDVDYMGTTRYSHIIYYENKDAGTRNELEPGRMLKYQGQPIQFECRGTIRMRSVDLNQDGYMDIVAGDEDGKVSWLKNTGRMVDGMPEFLPPRFLQQEAKFVDLGSIVAPRVYDWDGDGLEDIVAGNGVGNIVFVKNLGGLIPSWDAPKLLEVNGQPIRIIPTESNPRTSRPHWGYVTIDVGLWDEDKLPDILANDHNGNVVLFKNIGSKKSPKLAPAQAVEVEWEGHPLRPTWSPGNATGNELLAPWRTSPFIMDFNQDGLNDLVMLDHEGYLAVYPRSQKDGQLLLHHPQRNIVFPDGSPILLNQLKNKSSGRLKITFADWDGDGLEDLVFSSKPAVDWMKNMGMENGKMVLQYMGRVVSKTMMGHTDGPVVSDFNKDGIPDLLVGTETGVLYYWERSNINGTTTMTTSDKQQPASYPYFKR
ncbi:FG-GAP repeat domain-containing protein [Membranihabitans marinus]|uniref:FG-GAP repeat domain-containing protein n=1 Tax=Membranihabitans marinus TaxID=1227546 RepID=UPI001F17D906|nr:VCBS repeat-containing protein [Membranihabitans marinus]